MSQRILILHNEAALGASAADRDVLVQVSVVAEACRQLGYAVSQYACTLDLAAIAGAVRDHAPEVVFNLVESLGGSDRLAALVPMLLEASQISYTGSPAAALDLTNCKPNAKRIMREHALPTPNWATASHASDRLVAGKYIIKASWEHASLGLGDDALLNVASEAQLHEALALRSALFPTGCFAEQFVEGREFNLSLLAGPTGPQALPPAEIDFSRFPAGKPRIVGYAAKWSEESFEFSHTPRCFDFAEADRPLLRQLQLLAVQCWRTFDLRGYARVDFRVNAAGQPLILEVNANPCLSPDAGFAAAVERAGIAFPTAVQRIIDDAQQPDRRPSGAADSRLAASASDVSFRRQVRADDATAVRTLVAATGKFRQAEVDVAVELVNERLAKGAASGYEFVFAERGGQVVGYACFGHITVTESSFDLYWIAVDPRQQGAGIGKGLMTEVERTVAAAGGTRVYIETSGRSDYLPTRAFYEASNYRLEAVVADFYAPGDDKALYVREIVRQSQTNRNT